MKQIMYFAAGLMAFFSFPCTAGNDAQEIITAVLTSGAVMYAKYDGVVSERDTVTHEYDSITGKELGVSKSHTQRKDFFYKKPSIVTTYYEKDGKVLSPRKNSTRVITPVYPFCDADALSHYTFVYGGIETLAKTRCHVITIVPKENTVRHFTGKAYFTEGTLDVFYVVGTIADYPYGVKKVLNDYFFVKVADGYAPCRGTSMIEIDVPVIMPNRRLVSEFTASAFDLIKK